ncbi:hypothetical protein [Desulfocastanea catecholica]
MTIFCKIHPNYTANVIAHHGVLDEGVEFIEKPYVRNDLVVRIRTLMERNSPAIYFEKIDRCGVFILLEKVRDMS